MKSALRLLPIIIVVIAGYSAFSSSLQIDTSQRSNPWTNLNIRDDPNNFQFAIVADRTGSARPGIFEKAVAELNLLQPQFVLCVGDLIEGRSHAEDPNIIISEWDQFDAIVRKLDMPFFYLAGNHDLSNPVMENVWQNRLGKTYYHFVYRNVLFLCLCTSDPSFRHISRSQVDYFRKALFDNQNVRWIFVFMHYPMWEGKSTAEWKNFEALLSGRPHTVFAGHNHRYVKSVINGQNYYTLATTGGSIKDPNDSCEFDHIVWVTMTDSGPRIANILLNGVLTDQPCAQN